MDGSVIQNGTLYNNVNFVDTPVGAMEVLYDRRELSEDKKTWLYFKHNYLVATMEASMGAQNAVCVV